MPDNSKGQKPKTRRDTQRRLTRGPRAGEVIVENREVNDDTNNVVDLNAYRLRTRGVSVGINQMGDDATEEDSWEVPETEGWSGEWPEEDEGETGAYEEYEDEYAVWTGKSGPESRTRSLLDGMDLTPEQQQAFWKRVAMERTDTAIARAHDSGRHVGAGVLAYRYGREAYAGQGVRSVRETAEAFGLDEQEVLGIEQEFLPAPARDAPARDNGQAGN